MDKTARHKFRRKCLKEAFYQGFDIDKHDAKNTEDNNEF
jgi:hypothetical protein